MTLAPHSRPSPTRILMDGALEHLEAARDLDGNPWETRPRVASAVRLIGRLRAGLDLLQGGAIAANVDDLYDYMCRRLEAAALQNGSAALDEVSHLLDALRSAWIFLPAEVHTHLRN